ncbi:MAG: MucR family transcriptional regulator [Alphaproteobacteria bacterium]|jgi:predicted transcriptional regulator|nr:MucR family transcriptional regulator [Alphaproteobacteria bacterium]
MARRPKSEAQEERAVVASTGDHLVDLTVNLVSSYVGRNQVPLQDVPGLIKMFHNALAQAAGMSAQAAAESERKPAVPVKKSVTDEYIVCLEDGKKLTMLKRYLRTHYNMSPEEYRKKWDLPHDYPMVAPAYARLRSAFAKKIGLGRVPVARGRRSKVA